MALLRGNAVERARGVVALAWHHGVLMVCFPIVFLLTGDMRSTPCGANDTLFVLMVDGPEIDALGVGKLLETPGRLEATGHKVHGDKETHAETVDKLSGA